jgi:hypothetical protein
MKELVKTPFIIAALTAAVGPDVDLAKLHVYEVTATSTVALRGKTGTIFERAKISPNTISQLARQVNQDPLPLMMDHDLRGTPYGKFFYAESIPMDNGETELRGLLYVDESEADILTKLNSSSIDEVSIQFQPEKMLCSECAFDYMAAAAADNYMPLVKLECDEGHKIAENGVHVNLVGSTESIELSLVSRGAAKNSKIINPSNAKLGEQAQRLAASGVELHNFYCTASASDEGVEEVDFEKFMAQLNAANTKTTEAEVAKTAAEAQVATLSADVASRDETIATLTAERDELAGKAEAIAAAEETNATLTTLKEYVGKQFVALKTLDGDASAAVLEDVAEMVTYIDANQARLSALIPAGGAALNAEGNPDNKTDEQKAEDERVRLTAEAYRSTVK